MIEKSKLFKNVLIDSAFIITIITIILYVITIAFQDGYLSYYNLSHIKCDITITIMIRTLSKISVYIIIVLFSSVCAIILNNFIPKLPSKISEFVFLIIIFTTVIIVLILNKAFNINNDYNGVIWYSSLIIFSIYVIGKTLYIILYKGKDKQFKLFKNDIYIITTFIALTCVFIIIIYRFFYYFGDLEAKNNKDYFISDKYGKHIVVYQDDDKYILMPLYDETSLTNEHLIINTNSLESIKLTPYKKKLKIFIPNNLMMNSYQQHNRFLIDYYQMKYFKSIKYNRCKFVFK